MTVRVVQYLVFGISLFVMWSFFSFYHCVVCPSNYGCRLPLWCQRTFLQFNNLMQTSNICFVRCNIVAIDGRKCWTTRTPQKTQGYTRFSWRVGNIWSTSGTRLTNPVTNHVRRQRGYTRFSWRVGNICSTSGTRLTNPITNHVRRK